LNKAGLQALNNHKYQLAIDLFQQAVKLDAKTKSVWDNLGRAYLDSGDTNKAIDAFQKQIAINAYDQFAYNNLGLAYERQSRWDDAAKQYQKQIDVNPLDPYAHANLGRLYMDQKRFAEAVSELEKAADLQPKNAIVQIHLGQAYLGDKQIDKGMASFEKAISVGATPLVWNNIAYSLSEQNVQLDRASQYADAAINALETQLSDVSLDNLRVQDLGTAQLLFSTWDTKGWIEYKRGNADVAERYIMAAWQSGGSGDESEHLGEIYEKSGKRDLAIHYYLLSLLAENPSQNARPRLVAMGIEDKDIDNRVAKLRPEEQKERSISLGQNEKGSAEYYLLISPSTVEQAKFIKGDDNLKNLGDVLRKTNASMKFPPDAKGHVVRRAKVQCGTAAPAACTLQMLPASDVRSLE